MRILLASLLVVAPSLAMAQSQLERFEDISERSTGLMLEQMISMAIAEGADASLADMELPSFEWNDAMREAAACMLERYETEIGSDGIDTMFDEMDALLTGSDAMTLEEIANAGESILPEGLTEQESLEITQACGMMDLQIQWMAESGIMEAMMTGAMGN